jgi:hypothetical protein
MFDLIAIQLHKYVTNNYYRNMWQFSGCRSPFVVILIPAAIAIFNIPLKVKVIDEINAWDIWKKIGIFRQNYDFQAENLRLASPHLPDLLLLPP